MKVQARRLRPGVFHFEFFSQQDMASSFIRMQEFYDSNIPGIKGEYFSYEKLMSSTSKKKVDEWGGFNIPGYKIKKFQKVFSKDLTEDEKTLLNILDVLLCQHPYKKYVVIATEYGKPEKIVTHEITHSYWYLDKEYREKILKILNRNIYIKRSLEPISIALLRLGYREDTILDEIHAYMISESESCLSKYLKDDEACSKLSQIKKFFESYDKIKRRNLSEGFYNRRHSHSDRHRKNIE